MSLLADLRLLFRPDSEEPPPVMDGPLTPNRALDDAQVLGEPLPGCDDLALAPDGSLLVSAGRALVRVPVADGAPRTVVATFDHDIGALAVAGDRVYVAVTGAGVARVERGAVVRMLVDVDGRPLRCVTALAVLPDGRVVIAEGSSATTADGWCEDLLRKRSLGRLVVADADLSSGRTLRDGLAWPSGLAVAPDGRSLWFSEAWRHRLQVMSPDGGAPRTVVPNLPGYPARLAPHARGGFWLSVFAVRTHLIDFVLREDAYREQMLSTIDPRYWIGPSLMATGHYLEPLQGGAIKKLGLVKPWAPPRSYGLVVHLSAQGEVLGSLHSRAGGRHHGVTAVRPVGDRLVVVAKGPGLLLGVGP